VLKFELESAALLIARNKAYADELQEKDGRKFRKRWVGLDLPKQR